jgi:hypothetical protein
VCKGGSQARRGLSARCASMRVIDGAYVVGARKQTRLGQEFHPGTRIEASAEPL